MEDIIKTKLCTSCKNNTINCEKIEVIKEGKCITYKCLNYEKSLKKIKPYKQFKYSIRSNNEKIKAMNSERLNKFF